jgi:peptidoglycan/LPS O-acetylase OafA/YrhL
MSATTDTAARDTDVAEKAPGIHYYTAPPPLPRPTTRGSFRRDIQGMRAIAVLAVVLSHAGVAGLTGGYVGVDVFFVISGFLITDHLLRELDATGRIRFGRFYARRIRRLLPAAVTVVVVTGVFTYLFESSLAARNLARDALWAAANAMNIKLAVDGTDYFASESAPSVLQHFWSLAVEEQFYLVWPLLLLVCGVLLARRRGTPGYSRRGVGAGLGLVLVVSLALSIWQTGVAQSWAYFGSHTRAWELAAGALVAFGLPVLRRIPTVLGHSLSWLGLVMIVAAVLTFTEQTPFPGYAALLPVLGSVLVVAGGSVATPGGAERLLGLRPFQAVGAVSYSWYLWHWPVLVLMPAVLGWEPTTLNNLFVVVIALLISIITYTNVENPLRTARWVAGTGRGLLLGLTLTVTLAVTATAALVALPPVIGAGVPIDIRPGDVTVVRDSLGFRAVPANLTPSVEQGPDDVPASRGNQCHLQLLEDQVRQPCDYGDPTGARRMVLFGDSHADAWLPAIEQIAGGDGYRLFSRTKAACPAVDIVVRDGDLGREYTECETWRRQVMAEIAAIDPAVVVMSGSAGIGNQSAADWARATTTTVSALAEQGIRVVYIVDTPRRGGDQPGPECVAAHLDDVSNCITPLAEAQPFRAISSAISTAVARSGGVIIDPTSWFCADDQCPSVIGNYLVYRDQSHVTASYMRFLAPELEQLLPLDAR